MNVLVIGCGQLGSRHAQSLAKHSKTTEISLVDPSKESLAVAAGRIRETGYLGNIVSYQRIKDLDEHYRFVVISTSSAQRPSALKDFLSHSKADTVLLEKLLAPNLDGVEEIANLVQDQVDRFWVNCPMPYFFHYAELERRICETSKSNPIHYRVTASNLGLVTNTIHYLDHFLGLTSRPVSKLMVEPNSITIPSKRIGYSEILGKIYAKTDFEDELTVEFEEKSAPHLMIEISCAGWVWRIDELQLTMSTRSPEGLIEHSSIVTPMQSELTHISIERLESRSNPHWADLNSSLVAHRLLLTAVSQYLGPKSDLVFT